MQPRLTVAILVLQAEVLVRAIRYLGFIFQTTSKDILRLSENIKLLFRSTNFFQPILQNSNFLGRSSPIQSIPLYFNRIISNNSSEGDRSEAVRRLRVRRFDRGRLKNRNRVRTAHNLRWD